MCSPGKKCTCENCRFAALEITEYGSTYNVYGLSCRYSESNSDIRPDDDVCEHFMLRYGMMEAFIAPPHDPCGRRGDDANVILAKLKGGFGRPI